MKALARILREVKAVNRLRSKMPLDDLGLEGHPLSTAREVLDRSAVILMLFRSGLRRQRTLDAQDLQRECDEWAQVIEAAGQVIHDPRG